MNVPGALTWNELATTDVERAKEFYGELFGWRFEDMEGGAMPYAVIFNGDRLERRHPPAVGDGGRHPAELGALLRGRDAWTTPSPRPASWAAGCSCRR